MSSALGALLQYRYVALFAYVLASQCGVPVPSTPVLLVAGALVASGQLAVAPSLAAAILACLVADSAWYALGRTRGHKVLRLLCRISLEPTACVRNAGAAIARHGAAFLLVAKFVPGVGLMVAPSAGQARMRYGRFVVFDAAGAALWSGAYVLLGGLVGRGLEAREALSLSTGFGAAVVGVSAVVVLVSRLLRLRRARRRLARARITVPELSSRIERGDRPFILDIRGRGTLEEDRLSVPGAIQLTMNELLADVERMHLDHEIVLVCDCPGDVASTEAAARLQRMGFERAVSLEGGLSAWKRAGLRLVEARARA